MCQGGSYWCPFRGAPIGTPKEEVNGDSSLILARTSCFLPELHIVYPQLTFGENAS
uniref:Uncharacterized protein n=1 Tax=Helianthus annuus TaxID=4232 RepID=A0A251SZ23_HELAN